MRRTEESWFRSLGWISYKAAGGKEGNIENFWAINGEKKEAIRKTFGSTPEEIKETIRKIKEAHKIK